MLLVEECGSAAVIIQQPAHFSVESPIGKAFLAPFGQTCPARLFFYDALRFDVIVPGVLRVSIEVIVIHFRSKVWIPAKITGCFITGRKMRSVRIVRQKLHL